MNVAVVKLGGSTARAAEMRAWVGALSASTLPLVIVPGGGPFADQVREAQRHIGFSDVAAHAMAILAMDQFGHVILDQSDRIVAARTLADMRDALELRRIPVWLPSGLAISAPDIPASWDMTSDALAGWLAGRLGAENLLLIKQSSAFSEHDDLDDLTKRGIVDRGLAATLPAGIIFRLACPADAATAGTELASGRLPGRPMFRVSAAMRRAG